MPASTTRFQGRGSLGLIGVWGANSGALAGSLFLSLARSFSLSLAGSLFFSLSRARAVSLIGVWGTNSEALAGYRGVSVYAYN
jgi:hypothetical protein